jgi:hypothetical protein
MGRPYVTRTEEQSMVRRPTLRVQAAFATIAAMLLLSAPALASWTEPGTTDASWSCGGFSYLTELRFQECVKRTPSTNAEYVQSIMLVSNTGTTARAVSGNTETFAGPGRGSHLSYGDCGPTVIAGPGHRWCYGQTKPVAKGTPIYGIGELSQAGESSFAYSPTPFTAPTPPNLPPPPGPCDDCDGDGSLASVDCVDNAPTIHPGSIDVPGNGIDEDCSGADAVVPVLDASILFDYGYGHGRRYTFFKHLSVQPARAGSTIHLHCRGRGCPFKTNTRTVKQTVAKVNLLPYLHHAKLRPHARLEVQVTKPGTIGRSRVFTIRSGGDLRRTDRCLAADKTPAKCPL